MSKREYVDFKKIKKRVSMPDLLSHYELTGQMEEKSEGTLLGPCPITGSESRAFKVNLDKDVWYSFALGEEGEGGNVLDFVAKMEDTDVLGAANLLDEWFPAGPQRPSEEELEEEQLREEGPAEEETEEQAGGAETFEPLGEDARIDARSALLRMCGEEIATLENEAREEIEALLPEGKPVEQEEKGKITERLHRWIVEAYRQGYRLGKMQGRIDERVSRLS